MRAILLTPEQEVLMMKIRLEDGDEPFWICPGGGLEAGEEILPAIRRELKEELGLESFELGPLVWRRRHTFNFRGRRLRQTEAYHIVHVNKFDPALSDEEEKKVFLEFRWLSLPEIRTSPERMTPLSLHRIVHDYLKSGPPQGELELEVLVD